jgi:hypothetical protein
METKITDLEEQQGRERERRGERESLGEGDERKREKRKQEELHVFEQCILQIKRKRERDLLQHVRR